MHNGMGAATGVYLGLDEWILKAFLAPTFSIIAYDALL